MAFDITLAPAEELELEPSARVHRMSGHRDAIAKVLSCSCGWTRKICADRMRSLAPPKCVARGPNISARSKPSASPLPYADGARPQSWRRGWVGLQFLATFTTLR